MPMIKEKTAQALRIVRDKQPSTAKQFARLMWPDSAGWRRVINTGHGAHRGRGMYIAAGSYLGKLRRQGLISGWGSNDRDAGFTLTDKGVAELNDFEGAAKASSSQKG